MYTGFQETGIIEWEKKNNPPKSLGPPANPKKCHAEFPSLKKFPESIMSSDIKQKTTKKQQQQQQNKPPE